MTLSMINCVVDIKYGKHIKREVVAILTILVKLQFNIIPDNFISGKDRKIYLKRSIPARLKLQYCFQKTS